MKVIGDVLRKKVLLEKVEDEDLENSDQHLGWFRFVRR